MSGIVLSSSVRQNLLSLQSTADLLATTQSRLSTGKKVNTALDNPTNFFTAQSLDGRASDISNLLDGIGNGVQVLQAANTGITSLQKLVDTAKSIANQALQTTVGYSTKSNVSATVSGATALDLRGTTSFTSATAISNALYNGTAGGASPATGASTLGATAGTLVSSAAVTDNASVPANITAATFLYGPASGAAGTGGLSTQAASSFADGDVFSVNGKTITIRAAALPAVAALASGSSEVGNVVTDGSGNSTVYLGDPTVTTSVATVGDLTTAFDLASGRRYIASVTSGVATLAGTASTTLAGITTLSSSTGADLSLTGKADSLKALKLTTAVGAGTTTLTAARATSATSLGNLVDDGSTLNVNGKTITFRNANAAALGAVPTGSGISNTNLLTDALGNSTIFLQGGTVADVLTAIDIATGTKTVSITSGVATVANATGATASTIAANGTLKLSTGTSADLDITSTGNALSVLGLTGPTGTGTSFIASRTAGTGGINGKTLTFSSFNGGTAVAVTFGDGAGGTVKTLDQLNAALLANNQTATIDSTGKLTISATNDYASSTLGSVAAGGAIGGTITSAIAFSTPSAPVIDSSAQAVRSNLVKQYNDILAQITTTAQDASFNGVNLLAGDQLKLTFNETGKSTLSITGVTFNAAGLGLANLASGTDFIDNAATNKVVANLSAASTSLRTQGSALGSNLSIVQIRQDFSKQLINVLQTGSSNLTLADTNEEAANSQALSTRQSIAVSALALANTSQQSVLQLLR
jgi:flagellin-like hook-associated protein FlgL